MLWCWSLVVAAGKVPSETGSSGSCWGWTGRTVVCTPAWVCVSLWCASLCADMGVCSPPVCRWGVCPCSELTPCPGLHAEVPLQRWLLTAGEAPGMLWQPRLELSCLFPSETASSSPGQASPCLPSLGWGMAAHAEPCTEASRIQLWAEPE